MGKLDNVGDGFLRWFDSWFVKDNRLYWVAAGLVLLFFIMLMR